LKFRVVVHHATVTVGGAMTLGAESLTGREINFLFRAEKFASAAGVTFCFSETAHERLASYLPLVPLAGSRELKGFDAPFQFYSMELSAEDTAEESGKATG
jgi:class 3 adenylate cyclase